jgi:CheY-like chemotaxis protein
VDDTQDVREQLRGYLQGAGWLVDEADSAYAAEEMLARTDYEIIVLDFVLPDADGVQCMRSWRAMGVTAPVLGLTAASADAVLEAFIKGGAHDVLEKSALDEETFLAAVEATGGPPGYPEEALPPLRRLAPEPGAVVDLGVDGPAFPSRRALVIDDTPAFRVLLRVYLEKDGWTVDEAPTAEDALRLATPQHDLVLLDYLLPDMDGATLLRRLRRMGVGCPVLGMTGHATEEVADDFDSAGAMRCVAKEGLSETRLRQAVKEALVAGAR